MEEIFKIPEIKSNTKFWMIRTKRGFFFNEYVREGFIAIGWNLITEKDLKYGLTKVQMDELKRNIEDTYGEKQPSQAVNKCLKFYNEIKNGDIAMIVDRTRIVFAKIGDYYEAEDEELTVANEKEINNKIKKASSKDIFKCPYKKRRSIEILRVIKETDFVSPYLYKAMVANRHSLSDLSEYADTILSSCFDMYIYDSKLTITFHVKQKEDIDALSLANFVSISAKILSNSKKNNVTVKTAVHSLGDIILQVGDYILNPDNVWNLVFLYVLIFGGEIKDFKLNSIMGFVQSLRDRDYNNRMKELHLEEKELQVELLRAQREDTKEYKKVPINENDALQLFDAVKELKIGIDNQKVVELKKYIEQHENNNIS